MNSRYHRTVATRNYRSEVRARQSAGTRREIIEAARTLFAERGYARTSVAAIAEAAGVAVNTVYLSVGGKAALILALTEDSGADGAAAESVQRVSVSDDPREILRITAEGTARVRRRQHATLSLVLDNRNADPDIAAAADLATRIVRGRLATVAERLTTVGGLRPELTRAQVEDTLWFYFGFEAWRAVRALGWDWDEAAEWLAIQAGRTLLP
jgi:AcrR family transcriptional regulator